jgi:hypothetical protein
MPTDVKSPQHVRAGKARAAERWSNPANRSAVKLADLTVQQRQLVLALVAAARAANADRQGA